MVDKVWVFVSLKHHGVLADRFFKTKDEAISIATTVLKMTEKPYNRWVYIDYLDREETFILLDLDYLEVYNSVD